MALVSKSRAFRLKSPCDECPWRRDTPIGRFPPSKFEELQSTVAQDFGSGFFACHKTAEDDDMDDPAVCAGYLLGDGVRNIHVRLAAVTGRLDLRSVRSQVPLYETFAEMAEANGCHVRRDAFGEVVQISAPGREGCVRAGRR